jgi:hypothetical protein
LLQTPLTQLANTAQALPQAPQLLRSCISSIQMPAHKVSCGAQKLHLPPWQCVPPPHLVPHAPQLFESTVRSAHAAIGTAVVAAQSATVSEPTGAQAHAPFVQAAPGGQTLPQVPQLYGSAFVFTHVRTFLKGHIVVAPMHVHPPMGA